MGFLGMSSRFALLSLGLLALAGCQMADQKSPETADQNPTATLSDTLEDVTCPGDRRCGQRAANAEKFPSMCTVDKTLAVAFLCGEDPTARLRCPGPGCPTGEPRPEDMCEIHLRVTGVNCKKTINEILPEDDAARDDPSPSAPVTAPAAE
jgi:hypothetical protein